LTKALSKTAAEARVTDAVEVKPEATAKALAKTAAESTAANWNRHRHGHRNGDGNHALATAKALTKTLSKASAIDVVIVDINIQRSLAKALTKPAAAKIDGESLAAALTKNSAKLIEAIKTAIAKTKTDAAEETLQGTAENIPEKASATAEAAETNASSSERRIISAAFQSHNTGRFCRTGR
jgi:replicative DNA helicase